MDCVFCKIASGEIETPLIYQNEHIVAFNDLDPKAPHHILIIPRKHIATLNDITDEDAPLISQMILTAKNLAKESGISESGYRVLINCNKEGGQAVYHVHLHLLGGRTMTWPPG